MNCDTRKFMYREYVLDKIWHIKDFPNAYAHYVNELTLPLYPQLTDEQVEYIIKQVNEAVGGVLV